MKILAIDTTAKVTTAAITDGEELIAETTLNTGNTHSETMLTIIGELLGKAGLTADDIELFACSKGPGSFTGVRIGISLIKGLAFGSGKPCVGVSTLDALAYNLRDYKGIISPVMDARRSQLYNAVYESDGSMLIKLTEDRLISAEQLRDEISLRRKELPVYFCGDGYQIAREAISLPGVMPTCRRLTYQSAYSVAQTALRDYNEGRALSDTELLPCYLRASQAERERAEKQDKEIR